MARSTLSSKLPQMKEKGKIVVRNMLTENNSVALTTDIWTDRTMRSYLGVTAHIFGKNPKTGKTGLLSLLLTCQQFKGRHTGERIAEKFDNVIDDFNLNTKDS